MDYQAIIYEKKDSIGIITLNRAAKKNALTEQMHREIIHVLEGIENDDEMKLLIVTGGPDVFCTGADLADVAETEDGMPTGPNAINRLADFSKPSIAVINGWCVAGGIELALACDLRFVAETALIGDRHIRIGFIGGAGSPTRLVRVVGPSKAMELILSGNTIDGQEAFRIGFANKVFPADKLMEGTMEFATKMAGNSMLALKLSKSAVKAAIYASEYQSMHDTDKLIFELNASAEYKEKVGNFLKK